MSKVRKKLLVIVGIAAIVTSLLVAATVQSVKAFCIFNCAAEDLANRMQSNLDCLQNQYMTGNYGKYGTQDLDSEGKLINIDGQWLTEDELKKDWKEKPEKHSSNCYFKSDVTPQEVERVYQESLK